jgi:mannan endo-1,6-alpha-mannosidase
MYEVTCEGTKAGCDTDQQSFKAYVATWMAGTAALCPWTNATITAYLTASAAGAAQQCE